MLRNIIEIQDYAETLCAYAGVKTGKKFSVRYVDNGHPHTRETPKAVEIVLPKLTMNATDEEFKQHKHFVIHEILHHTEGPDIFKIAHANKIPSKPDDPLRLMWNATEDFRIERIGSEKYIGDAISIREGTEIAIKQYVSQFKGMSKESEEFINKDKAAAALFAMVARDMPARNDWCHPSNIEDWNGMVKSLPKAVQENIAKLDGMDYTSKLNACKTEQDTLDLAKETFKLLMDEDPDEHCKNNYKPDQGEEEGEGEGQEGQNGEGKGKAKGAAKGKGNDSEGDGEGTPVHEFKDANGKVVDYRKILQSSHTSGSGSGINLRYKENHKENGDFIPTPHGDIRVKDYSRYQPRKCDYEHEGRRGRFQKYEVSRGFANKVRRLIQIKSQARYIGGQTKGKVNRKQIYRVGVPIVGNGEWNSKVFKRKYQDDILDTTIQLVVDASGSMSGQKYYTAVQAAIMLNHAFDKALHIPVEILAFSETGNTMSIGLIKQAHNRLDDTALDYNFRCFADECMGNNSDGEALMYAAHRLRQRPEKRKIMIVLSDGSPASSRPGDETAYTKAAINEIEQEGVIDLYGIGILYTGVSRLYSRSATIKGLEELEPTILKVIKEKLKL